MGAQLFAVCFNHGRGRDFRLPTTEDRAAVHRAQDALVGNWDDWNAEGLIPTEPFPEDTNDQRPNIYGMDQWHKLFAPRQLLGTVTYAATLRELSPEIEIELGSERASAVRTYLGFALDKCINFNSIIASWDASRDKIRSVFDRHDFAMKWSFAEMNMATKDSGAFPWSIDQVVDSYKGLCELVGHSRPLFDGQNRKNDLSPVQVTNGNAARLSHLADDSVER